MEDRLQKFRVLVAVGSFTEAARKLHISQPALTMAIAKLERELGVQLLVHGERQLKLTKAGRIAHIAAKEQEIVQKNLRGALADATNARVSLAVGMIDSVAAVVGDDFTLLESTEPKADLAVVVNNSRVLLQDVVDGRLDFACIVAPSEAVEGIRVRTVSAESMVLVCAPGMSGEVSEQLSAGSIWRYISYDKGSRTRRLIEQSLQALGVKTIARFFSTSPDIMLRLVLAERGVAILPYSLVKPYLENGALLAAKLAGLPVVIERPIVCITRKGVKLPNVAEALIGDINSLLQSHSTPKQ